MPHIEVGPPPTGPICDFCSSPNIHKVYGSADFQIDKGELALGSRGAWHACQPCAELIDADRWRDLLDRSAEIFCKKFGNLPGLRKRIRHTHELFREHRRAEA